MIEPGMLVQATSLPLEHEPLPAAQVIAGHPSTGLAVLADGTPEIGVWEMTPGTATDVEIDEVFIVIAGRATLELPGLDPIELTPGAVVRLSAGMQGRWTVHETLRKVYVA